MTESNKGILLAICGASLWGASGAGAQLIFSHTSMTASWLVAVRLIFAGLIMTVIGLVRNPGQTKGLLTNRGDLGILIAFTFLGMLNSQFTYMKAVQTSNAPTATVIQYLQPVLIIVWFTLRNRAWPRRLDILSITIALVGTFFLVTGGHLNSLSLTPIALFWGLMCALAAAIYTVLPQGLLSRYDTLTVCGLGMLIGGIFMSPVLVLTPLPNMTAFDWGTLVYIVIFGTILAYTLFLSSINYISPAVTGMLSAFEPLVATTLAVAFLGTKLTAASVLGSLLIILCTLIQSLPLKRILDLLHLAKH